MTLHPIKSQFRKSSLNPRKPNVLRAVFQKSEILMRNPFVGYGKPKFMISKGNARGLLKYYGPPDLEKGLPVGLSAVM